MRSYCIGRCGCNAHRLLTTLSGEEAAAESAAWWDPNDEGLCIWAAYEPKGAANFAASLNDLSGNGNNAGDPGGANTPTWDAANGWKFDGIDDYLTTTFAADQDQSQTVLIQYTNLNYVDQDSIFGQYTPAATCFLIQMRVVLWSFRNTSTVWQNSSGGPAVAGNVGIAGDRGYVNGVADTAALPAAAAPSAKTCMIGANNGGAGVTQFIQAYIQALAIYDCTLTAPQVAAVAAAMAVL